MKNKSFQLRSMFTPSFLLTSFLTVAVTISACGPGQKTKTTTVPEATTSGQKLVGTQLGEDQPVSDQSMEILGKDWAERPAAPSHRRVKVKTPIGPSNVAAGTEETFVGPQFTPAVPEEVAAPAAPEAVLPKAPDVSANPEGTAADQTAVSENPSAPEEQPEASLGHPAPAEKPSPPVPPVQAPAVENPPVQAPPVQAPPAQVQSPQTPLPPAVDAARPAAPVVPAQPAVTKPDPSTEVPLAPVASKPAVEQEKVAPLPPLDPKLLKLDQSTRTIRVRIFPHLYLGKGEPFKLSSRPGEAQMGNAAGFTVLNSLNQEIAQGFLLHFYFHRGIIKIAEKEFPLSQVTIIPRSEQHLTAIDDIEVSIEKMKKAKLYRGQFRIEKVPVTAIKRDANGKPMKNAKGHVITERVPTWSIINYVDIEDYIVAVVPVEIGPLSPREALIAQAIAARSYAVYHVLRAREKTSVYDLESTTVAQVYAGYIGEFPDTPASKIIDESEGKILVHGTKVICANYTANSGGVTCSAEDCFGNPLPYLVARVDAEGVRSVAGGQRATGFSLESASKVLKGMGLLKEGDVSGISILHKNSSDRVQRLRMEVWSETNQHTNVDLSEAQTTALLKALELSRYMSVSGVNGSRVSLLVYGSGHGVGLSQRGAILQAKRGVTAEQILAFYFANTRIKPLGLARVR